MVYQDEGQKKVGGAVGGALWWVSDDSLLVLCRVPSVQTLSATAEDIVNDISAKGIVSEIDLETLAGLLQTGSAEGAVIARGIAPKSPVEGKLEFFIDTDSINHAPVEDESGRIDYKNLKMFQSVTAGQPLVRRHDPEPGSPGTDVFGKLIPIENLPPVTLPIGAGIKLEDKGYLGIAAIDGALTLLEDRLCVMAVFILPKDVSYKSGNIAFNGSVDVGRDVLSGFSIKAEGDVIVRGVVEGATIEAQGNIVIFGGVQGGGRAVLRAGGNIEARFVNEAKVEADGNIVIRSSVTNSDLRAKGTIEVTAGNGILTGGSVRARLGIKVPNLGSKLGVVTLCQIGLDDDLVDRINAAEDIVASTTRVGMKNQNRIEELIAMRNELKVLQEAQVAVTHTLYPGTIVRFPGAQFECKDALKSVVLYVEKWKIKNHPFRR